MNGFFSKIWRQRHKILRKGYKVEEIKKIGKMKKLGPEVTLDQIVDKYCELFKFMYENRKNEEKSEFKDLYRDLKDTKIINKYKIDKYKRIEAIIYSSFYPRNSTLCYKNRKILIDVLEAHAYKGNEKDKIKELCQNNPYIVPVTKFLDNCNKLFDDMYKNRENEKDSDFRKIYSSLKKEEKEGKIGKYELIGKILIQKFHCLSALCYDNRERIIMSANEYRESFWFWEKLSIFYNPELKIIPSKKIENFDDWSESFCKIQSIIKSNKLVFGDIIPPDHFCSVFEGESESYRKWIEEYIKTAFDVEKDMRSIFESIKWDEEKLKISKRLLKMNIPLLISSIGKLYDFLDDSQWDERYISYLNFVKDQKKQGMNQHL